MSAISRPRRAGRLATAGALCAVLVAPPALAAQAVLGPSPAGGPQLVAAGQPDRSPAAPPLAARAALAAEFGAQRRAARLPEARQAPARERGELRRADFAHFTLRSRATRDVRGVERSLYRGRYFVPAMEPKRRCIVRRESMGHYDVVSPSGAYFGAYQVSRPLARGATWMMLPEHRRLLGAPAARRILAELRRKPMNTWPRYWQDAAFSTVMNWEHTGSGASHWAGGRWGC